jgi:hypothetical protein
MEFAACHCKILGLIILFWKICVTLLYFIAFEWQLKCLLYVTSYGVF